MKKHVNPTSTHSTQFSMEPPSHKLELHEKTCLSMFFHVFPIYMMVVPLKVCIVGTHWMQNLIPHFTCFFMYFQFM